MFSPSGLHIAHTPLHDVAVKIHDRGPKLTVDLLLEKRDVDTGAGVEVPTWSSDSRKLLVCGQGKIWALGYDGNYIQCLGDGYSPKWSPDGKFIAYLRSPQKHAYALWVMQVQ